MKLRILIRLIIFPLVLLLVIAGAAIFWFADPMYLRAPSDKELIALFQTHRASFEELHKMMAEDSLTYINESRLDSRLGKSRIFEYKRLLSEIHSGLVVTRSDRSARFLFASGGLLAIGPGWSKGIEYVTGDVSRAGVMVSSLDSPRSLEVGEVYLRQIEPKWFVLVQKTE